MVKTSGEKTTQKHLYTGQRVDQLNGNDFPMNHPSIFLKVTVDLAFVEEINPNGTLNDREYRNLTGG